MEERIKLPAIDYAPRTTPVGWCIKCKQKKLESEEEGFEVAIYVYSGNSLCHEHFKKEVNK